MIDLHVHSTHSDGTFSPAALVDLAINRKLTAIALTDHDCVDAIDEAIAYTHSLKDKGVANVPEIVPGVELSCFHKGREVHMVGLLIDHHNKELREFLDSFLRKRNERNEKMCQLLTEAGAPLTMEEITAEYPNAVITRAHFAKVMIRKGLVGSMDEAFNRYIGDHAPCYVTRETITPMDACELILRAGGVPILAHPCLYHLSSNNLERLVHSLKEHGLMGIEVLYSTHTKKDEFNLRNLAKRHNLLISGGSDFHGANKKDLELGIGYGKLKVPESVLEDIRSANRNILFTDMDGTLLNNSNDISPEIKAALDRLVDKGHKLVLTSGRPVANIRSKAESMGICYPGMQIIAFNGGMIYDIDSRSIIKKYTLSADIINTTARICAKHGIHVHGYTDTAIVSPANDKELKHYRIKIDLPYYIVDDLGTALGGVTPKLIMISLDDHEALEELKKELDAELGDSVFTMFSNVKYLELVPAGIGKGSALSYLTDFLPMSRTRTFSAGDEGNDVSMIQAAHTGVAMANAVPEAKKAADIITQKDNDNDGLLEILNKYFND